MDDPRLTPARPDLAAKYLEGKVKAARFVDGEEFEVRRGDRAAARGAVADAELLTQALKGERVTIYDRNGEGFAWGQLNSDGYVGWLPDAALAKPAAAPTHKVTALRTFAFPGPSIKLPPIETLPMGAQRHGRARRRRLRRDARRLVSAAPASRRPRRDGNGFRRGRRTLRRHALSLGRQEQPRHRLLRPGADLAERRRHRLPARQRHAAGRPRPGAGRGGDEEAAARRSDLLERPCRHRPRRRHHRARQCASHGDRDREHPRGHRADQGGGQRGDGDQAAL